MKTQLYLFAFLILISCQQSNKSRDTTMESNNSVKPKKTENDTIREGARLEIVGTMKKHVEGLKKSAANLPGYNVTWQRWEKLFSDDILRFTSNSALEEIDNALQDGKHHFRSKAFPDIYVAVSVMPSIDNEKCMNLFPGGYFTVVDGLLKESGWLQSDRDFAHWIYCYEGKDKHKVHLTFIPTKSLAGKENVWVWAQDLMTDEEKSRAGIK